MERELNLGFGFPAVVAIAPSKNKVSIMKGSFDQLDNFLNDLILGKAVLDDLKQKPVFKKVDKWDGKDAAPLEVSFKIININPRIHPTQTIFEMMVLQLLGFDLR